MLSGFRSRFSGVIDRMDYINNILYYYYVVGCRTAAENSREAVCLIILTLNVVR